MAATLRHRGPDDSGNWIDREAGIALGHRRLAIVDLSEAGHQPMVSHHGNLVITFNGEVYNFAETRRELERIGHRFRGRSDTEVVLAAFESFGIEEALRRFAGMFALGLWDRKSRVLHLVRDRLGKKPLYIAVFDGALLFASELKALLAFPGFRPKVDADALASVLRYGWVPERQCIWQGVFKLPPGTMLSVSAADLESNGSPPLQDRLCNWWSLAEVAEKGHQHPLKLCDADLEIELDRLLRLVVRERMVADVPLGAFLSGGIDSSLVVALMQAQSTLPVRTFTIGFRETEYDEGGEASRVARYLGTEHSELQVTPAEACAVIPELPTIWDEPFAAESQIPTLLVSRLARQDVTVALSGDGGDETFAGYNRHFAAAPAALILALPLNLRRAAASFLRLSASETREWLLGKVPLPGALRGVLSTGKFADLLDVGDEHQLYERLISLGSPGTFSSRTANGVYLVPALPDLAARMMYRDTVTYLPGDILVKVDRATMAVSLEARCPLLDHRLVEFAWQLPTAAKVQNGTGKRLLRRVLRRYLPQTLFERPKHGFNVPIGAWLKGSLRDWAEELLAAPRLTGDGFVDPSDIASVWQEHLSGRRDRGYELWAILMVEAWLNASCKWNTEARTLGEPEAVIAQTIHGPADGEAVYPGPLYGSDEAREREDPIGGTL